MEVNQYVLDGIKKIADGAKSLDLSHYLGRAFTAIQANPGPVVAAIVVVAIAIFAYKHFSNQEPKSPPPTPLRPVKPAPDEKPEGLIPPQQLAPQPDPLLNSVQRNLNMSLRIGGEAVEREVTSHDLCESLLIIDAQTKANETSEKAIETVADALHNHVGIKLTAMHEVAKNMQTALEFAKTHGTGITSASFSIFFGLGQIFTGAFPTGVVAVAAGALEIIKIRNSYQSFEIADVFKDLKTNFEVIKNLSEQNQVSLNNIDAHLANAKNQILKINGVLDEIESIVVRGNEELVKLRTKTRDLYNQAKQKSTKGIELILESKLKTSQAKESFESCWETIDKISELGTQEINEDTQADVVKAFCLWAEFLKNSFEGGMRNFNESQKNLEEGLKLIQESERHNFEVRLNMQMMHELQKTTYKAIRTEAAKRVALEALNQAQVEIKDLADQVRIAEDKIVEQVQLGQDKVEDGKKIFEAHVTKQLICSGIAATLAGLMAGPIAGGIAAACAPKLIEEGAKFFTPLTSLVTNYEMPSIVGDIKMGFYTKSTGYFHYFKGPSKSYGLVSIHMGDRVKDYNFDLKKPNCGINLTNLATDLIEACERNVLAPNECLEILNKLNKLNCNGTEYCVVKLGEIDLHFKTIDQIAKKNEVIADNLSISLNLSNMINSQAG
jgi:hypothetical protein